MEKPKKEPTCVKTDANERKKGYLCPDLFPQIGQLCSTTQRQRHWSRQEGREPQESKLAVVPGAWHHAAQPAAGIALSFAQLLFYDSSNANLVQPKQARVSLKS